MIIQLVLFFTLATIAIAAALGMLLSQNAVYSALYLIINLCTIAVFYLLLHAPFLAIAQVTVYAGAIMVLFLFVIMLLGVEKLPDRKVLPWQRPVAIVLAILLLVEMGTVIITQRGDLVIAQAASLEFGDPKAIGRLLFSAYLLPFEATSILLLTAAIGAIVLTKREKK